MKYIEWIDTNAGHIILFLFLMLVGIVIFLSAKEPFGKEIAAGAMSALFYAMKAGSKTT
jgi:cell division protein FtsW (lipid II flippase)